MDIGVSHFYTFPFASVTSTSSNASDDSDNFKNSNILNMSHASNIQMPQTCQISQTFQISFQSCHWSKLLAKPASENLLSVTRAHASGIEITKVKNLNVNVMSTSHIYYILKYIPLHANSPSSCSRQERCVTREKFLILRLLPHFISYMPIVFSLHI